MKLTKNFNLIEFIESVFYNPEIQKRVWREFENNKSVILPEIQKLANQLQVLRDTVNRPISISIAYRPLFWELLQKRSGKSEHVRGKAADIKVSGMTPKQVAAEIEKLIAQGDMLQGGIGIYSSWVHYDIRRTRVRW